MLYFNAQHAIAAAAVCFFEVRSRIYAKAVPAYSAYRLIAVNHFKITT
jgi:hypothetical protein